MSPKTNLPLNYTEPPHKKYYCSVGQNDERVRLISEEHMYMCLYMGIKISGINQEVAPGQSEFQIGPEIGLKACDDLWVARFVLLKLSEKYNVMINFHPKPLTTVCKDDIFTNDWVDHNDNDNDSVNGSGCHTNFSTVETREKNGYDKILLYINNLKENHTNHIKLYGEHNNLRLTGKNETSSIDNFSWSVGGRHGSVRVPNETFKLKCGYFEDRRPASNMDPYIVCSLILKTCKKNI